MPFNKETKKITSDNGLIKQIEWLLKTLDPKGYNN